MNCLYITLFFNIVAGIVQIFIKSWNQLLYPWVIEVCHLKKVVRDQRWPTAPLFVMNISPFFGEFMEPFHHIFLIHNVTINSNNLFVNSSGLSPLALRNRMTECTSHLAGLWISTAISNVSHSNKADSTTFKWAQLTGKRSKSMAVLP